MGFLFTAFQQLKHNKKCDGSAFHFHLKSWENNTLYNHGYIFHVCTLGSWFFCEQYYNFKNVKHWIKHHKKAITGPKCGLVIEQSPW